MSDIINTMLHIHQQQGKLPVWHLMGCETNCMVGNPGVIYKTFALVHLLIGSIIITVHITEFRRSKAICKIPDKGFYKREMSLIIADFQILFYQTKYAELEVEIDTLEKELANKDAAEIDAVQPLAPK